MVSVVVDSVVVVVVVSVVSVSVEESVVEELEEELSVDELVLSSVDEVELLIKVPFASTSLPFSS